MPKPALKSFPSTLELTPEEQEAQYVHQVYDKIAPHFSQTRYKVRLPLILTSSSHIKKIPKNKNEES